MPRQTEVKRRRGKVLIFQGDTYQLNVTVCNEDDTRKDITNADIQYQVLEKISGDVKISKDNSGSDVNITDADQGEFTVFVNATETDSLEGTYSHKAIITDEDGNRVTVFCKDIIFEVC